MVAATGALTGIRAARSAAIAEAGRKTLNAMQPRNLFIDTP
jgi:hypothetical protein